MEPTLREAIDNLGKPDEARLKFAFEVGDPAFIRIKGFTNLYVGVHLDQLDFMELVQSEGKWSLGRKIA